VEIEHASETIADRICCWKEWPILGASKQPLAVRN